MGVMVVVVVAVVAVVVVVWSFLKNYIFLIFCVFWKCCFFYRFFNIFDPYVMPQRRSRLRIDAQAAATALFLKKYS